MRVVVCMLSVSSSHWFVPSVKSLSSILCRVKVETLGSAGALKLPICAGMCTHIKDMRNTDTQTHCIWLPCECMIHGEKINSVLDHNMTETKSWTEKLIWFFTSLPGQPNTVAGMIRLLFWSWTGERDWEQVLWRHCKGVTVWLRKE